MPNVDTLAESAQRIMAEHPAEMDWQRLESRTCAGSHRAGRGMGGSLIYWRRRRDYIDLKTGKVLDTDDDPPLWVAEQVPPTLCTNYRFYYANQITANLADCIGAPWSFSGPLAAGATVRLSAANGSWVWELIGRRDCACGGWIARWPD